jgi:phage terminase small subunit
MRRARKSNGTPVLTAKEEAFIGLYIRNSNALRAARDAGYRSAEKASFTLLRKPHMVAEIVRRQKLLREKEEFSLEKLFEWSVFGATYDAGSILKGDTFEILHPKDWPDQRMRRLIESFKTTVTISRDGEKKVVTEIKFAGRHAFYDRVTSLMGVRKKFDIKVEETRSIPLAVIDAITAKWDSQTSEAKTTSAPAQPKRLSITEAE